MVIGGKLTDVLSGPIFWHRKCILALCKYFRFVCKTRHKEVFQKSLTCIYGVRQTWFNPSSSFISKLFNLSSPIFKMCLIIPIPQFVKTKWNQGCNTVSITWNPCWVLSVYSLDKSIVCLHLLFREVRKTNDLMQK